MPHRNHNSKQSQDTSAAAFSSSGPTRAAPTPSDSVRCVRDSCVNPAAKKSKCCHKLLYCSRDCANAHRKIHQRTGCGSDAAASSSSAASAAASSSSHPNPAWTQSDFTFNPCPPDIPPHLWDWHQQKLAEAWAKFQKQYDTPSATAVLAAHAVMKYSVFFKLHGRHHASVRNNFLAASIFFKQYYQTIKLHQDRIADFFLYGAIFAHHLNDIDEAQRRLEYAQAIALIDWCHQSFVAQLRMDLRLWTNSARYATLSSESERSVRKVEYVVKRAGEGTQIPSSFLNDPTLRCIPIGLHDDPQEWIKFYFNNVAGARGCPVKDVLPTHFEEAPTLVHRREPDGTESNFLCVGGESYNQADDTLHINEDEAQREAGEAATADETMQSVTLFGLGFELEQQAEETKSRAPGQLSRLAGAFLGEDPLPIRYLPNLSAVQPHLETESVRTRALFLIAHQHVGASFGTDGVDQVLQFLKSLYMRPDYGIQVVVLLGCHSAVELLPKLRQMCEKELSGPLSFHIVAFHDYIYPENSNCATLLRSLLCDHPPRLLTSAVTQRIHQHRADMEEKFFRCAVRQLALDGFTQIDRFTYLHKALALCSMRLTSNQSPAVAAGSALPASALDLLGSSVPQFCPCSVYVRLFGEHGRIIGDAAGVERAAMQFASADPFLGDIV